MFIWNSRHTVRFPVSRIEEIHPDCGPEGDQERYSKIFLEGDNEAIVLTSDLDAIGDHIVSVVPVPPGYSLIHPALTDRGKGYAMRLAPVIGFAVTSNGDTRPLTARGIQDGMFRPMPMLYPDGTVWDEASDCGYHDVALYLIDWAGDEKQRQEHAAEHAARVPA